MTKKPLVIMLAILTAAAAISAVGCSCVFGGGMRPAQAQAASCGHCPYEKSQDSHAKQSGKDCCGKCQFEKAAVPNSKVLTSKTSSHPDTLHSIVNRKASDGVIAFSPVPSGFREAETTFFLLHVLNTTYSLHSPPVR